MADLFNNTFEPLPASNFHHNDGIPIRYHICNDQTENNEKRAIERMPQELWTIILKKAGAGGWRVTTEIIPAARFCNYTDLLALP